MASRYRVGKGYEDRGERFGDHEDDYRGREDYEFRPDRQARHLSDKDLARAIERLKELGGRAQRRIDDKRHGELNQVLAEDMLKSSLALLPIVAENLIKNPHQKAATDGYAVVVGLIRELQAGVLALQADQQLETRVQEVVDGVLKDISTDAVQAILTLAGHADALKSEGDRRNMNRRLEEIKRDFIKRTEDRQKQSTDRVGAIFGRDDKKRKRR